MAAGAVGVGFGHVLIEAMSAGKAILASDTPTHWEVLDPYNAGLFFKTSDPDDMEARQMLRMFDEAPLIAPRALAAAPHFSLKSMIDGYENSCLAAVGSHATRVEAAGAQVTKSIR